jgi:hypothetical protein
VRAVAVRLSIVVGVAALLSMAGCSDGGEASRSPASSPTATTVPVVRVGRIAATIAPEAARLGDDADIDLSTEVRTILERVDELLQFDSDVAVRVVVDADAVIHEIGLGGYTDPASGAVLISLDPESSIGTEQSITVWLPQVLAHELNHTKRFLEGPGGRRTLGEAIVTEGLADAFSLQAFPATPPVPWANALEPGDLDRLATLARSNAATVVTPDVHSEWFFGSGDLPRWAGYTIGAHGSVTFSRRMRASTSSPRRCSPPRNSSPDSSMFDAEQPTPHARSRPAPIVPRAQSADARCR